MQKRLIFIRHGQTDENKDDTLHVHQKDEAGLNVQGKKQIEKVVTVCKKNKVSAIFCSPEKRAIESAGIIAKALDIQLPIILPELLERQWGEWEGKPWEEVEKKLEKMTLDERYTFVPPHGESWEHMEGRLRKALREILENNGRNIAVVTHGGALRGLMPILKNAPKQISFIYQFHNASVTIFDYKNGKYIEKAVNDISHLDEELKDCIFCQIAKRKSPAYIVWEDKEHLAFLSITPNTEGFTVVIPKRHFSGYVFGMPDEATLSFMHAVKEVSQLLEARLDDVGRTAVILEGFGVDHAHAKLFPMHGTIGMRIWNKGRPKIKKFFKKYEGYVSSHSADRISDEKLQKIAEKIRNTK